MTIRSPPLAVSIYPLLTPTDIILSFYLSFTFLFSHDALPILSPAQTPFPARGEREKRRRKEGSGEGPGPVVRIHLDRSLSNKSKTETSNEKKKERALPGGSLDFVRTLQMSHRRLEKEDKGD